MLQTKEYGGSALKVIIMTQELVIECLTGMVVLIVLGEKPLKDIMTLRHGAFQTDGKNCLMNGTIRKMKSAPHRFHLRIL